MFQFRVGGPSFSKRNFQKTHTFPISLTNKRSTKRMVVPVVKVVKEAETEDVVETYVKWKE